VTSYEMVRKLYDKKDVVQNGSVLFPGTLRHVSGLGKIAKTRFQKTRFSQIFIWRHILKNLKIDMHTESTAMSMNKKKMMGALYPNKTY
jgi:hypothetical protein